MKKLTGVFDNAASGRRERWIDGVCAVTVERSDIQDGTYNRFLPEHAPRVPLTAWGSFPDLPGNEADGAELLERALAVLRELVRLKDLHDAIDGTTPAPAEWIADYVTNKPKAWAAARDLVR